MSTSISVERLNESPDESSRTNDESELKQGRSKPTTHILAFLTK